MKKFKSIPPHVLRDLNTHTYQLPTAYYYHPFLPLRWYFWLRIRTMTGFVQGHGQEVLDLGGGSGVFLPTLAGLFKTVICLDLWMDSAEKIVSLYKLKNVTLYKEDILSKDFEPSSFDVIIASDVLEHFKDPVPVIKNLKSWLKPGGKLIVSGPMENWLQKTGRKILKLTPPPDHYHDMNGIEKDLLEEDFVLKRKVYLPFRLPALCIANVLELEKR